MVFFLQWPNLNKDCINVIYPKYFNSRLSAHHVTSYNQHQIILANTGKMEAGDDEKTALISVRGWEVGEPIARPSIWRGKQMVLVACILFTELCERLTFYSVTANLLLYGTTVLDLESTTATSVSLYFTG